MSRRDKNIARKRQLLLAGTRKRMAGRAFRPDPSKMIYVKGCGLPSFNWHSSGCWEAVFGQRANRSTLEIRHRTKFLSSLKAALIKARFSVRAILASQLSAQCFRVAVLASASSRQHLFRSMCLSRVLFKHHKVHVRRQVSKALQQRNLGRRQCDEHLSARVGPQQQLLFFGPHAERFDALCAAHTRLNERARLAAGSGAE